MSKLKSVLAIAPRKLACALALGVATLPALATELLVPAYFYPSWNPAFSQWDEMTAAAAAGASITAIINPNNGPGAGVNSDYVNAISSFRAAGGKVLGYVYTCYGNNNCNPVLPAIRTTGDVLADAQAYFDWYNVDGIFLDEMSNLADALPFYQAVADGLRSARPGASIVGNPGTSTPEAYLAVADTLVTFERGTGSYEGTFMEPWMLTAPANRQAHLHYAVATSESMLALAEQASARNAGYLYITDDVLPNPWDRLPTYWNDLAAISAVPEPSTLLMFALGGVALARRASRGARQPS